MNLFMCCETCEKEKPFYRFKQVVCFGGRRRDNKTICLDCLYGFNDMRWLRESRYHTFWKFFLRHEEKSHPSFIRKRFCLLARKRLKRIFLKGRLQDYNSIVIGCTPLELKNHLESQFTPEMTWENRGEVWHIDHIKPLALFDNENMKHANLYTNLQPMIASENLKKGKRYDGI